MIAAPIETSDDLAERYRQTRSFDLAEVRLVRALCQQSGQLEQAQAHIIRYGLNLARLWVLDCEDGRSLNLGPKLGKLRDKLKPLVHELREKDRLDLKQLAHEAEALRPIIHEAKQDLIAEFSGQIPISELERELRNKTLCLVLGGGGGCGYVHLGALALLERLQLNPGLIVGSSLGSVMGLFRSRFHDYREEMVQRVTGELKFKNLFRILEGEARYGLPGTLRLYLRSAMAKYFMSKENRVLTLGELDVPFLCVVTGIRRDVVRADMQQYQHEFTKRMRRGPLGALLHVKGLVTSWTGLIKDLITSGGMESITLGACEQTRHFDALDAVGFSCSVPALIHYDILRDDARMHEIAHGLLKKHQVDHLIDGGISSNVPARAAWEAIQRGRIKTRNTFIFGLDCFAPQLRRNLIFLPLMKLAAENVARDRAFAHSIFTFRKVLSPASLLPNAKSLHRTIMNGENELQTEQLFLKTMLEPITLA